MTHHSRITSPSPVTGKHPGNYLDGDPLRTPMARDKNAFGSRYNPPDTLIQTQNRRDYEPIPNLLDRPITPNQFENPRDLSMSQSSSEEDPGPPGETPPKKAEREEPPKGSVEKEGKREWLSAKNRKSFFKSRPPKISLESQAAGSKPRGGWYGGLYLDVDRDDFHVSTVRIINIFSLYPQFDEKNVHGRLANQVGRV